MAVLAVAAGTRLGTRLGATSARRRAGTSALCHVATDGTGGALAANVSTRTVQIAHNVLVRAIWHAECHDLMGRNVAALVKPPKGQSGRQSKALTLEQAVALLEAATDTRLEAYIVVSLLAGLRTEALRWDHVVAWVGGRWRPVTDAGFDHEQLAVFVWRSDRAGGDTKTPKSRRTLALPQGCVRALREQRARQAEDRLAAGPLWRDHGLVFASAVGTPMDHHNVRREVPADHRGRWAGHQLGTAGASALVRVVAVRARRAGGSDLVHLAGGVPANDRDTPLITVRSGTPRARLADLTLRLRARPLPPHR